MQNDDSSSLADLSEEAFLSVYDPSRYPHPAVTADIVVLAIGDPAHDASADSEPAHDAPAVGDPAHSTPTISDPAHNTPTLASHKQLECLLVKRGGHPFKGYWCLPGGFVDPGEDVGQAALRELKEETGIQAEYLEQLYTFSAPGRDPRDWTMTVAHLALVDKSQASPLAGDDAAEAVWFKVGYQKAVGDGPARLALQSPEGLCLEASLSPSAGNVPYVEPPGIITSELAFDHASIIGYAFEHLQSKADVLPTALYLLPGHHTRDDLKQACQLLLGSCP